MREYVPTPRPATGALGYILPRPVRIGARWEVACPKCGQVVRHGDKATCRRALATHFGYAHPGQAMIELSVEMRHGKPETRAYYLRAWHQQARYAEYVAVRESTRPARQRREPARSPILTETAPDV